MSTEFKDKVKKEVEEEEQERILTRCKRGLRRLRKTLDEAKKEYKQAQMMHDNFLQLVASDPESAAHRFGQPSRQADNKTSDPLLRFDVEE